MTFVRSVIRRPVRSADLEVVLHLGRHGHELSAGQLRAGQVGHVVRIRTEHFVPGVEDRAQRQLKPSLTPAVTSSSDVGSKRRPYSSASFAASARRSSGRP